MNIKNCTGIYGLYLDGKLVYIGKTIQSFQKRYLQHKRLVENPDESEQQYDMYYELAVEVAKGKSLQLIPIFIVETAQYNSLYHITNRDLESMEFILIQVYKPKYNVAGIRVPYKYTH